MVLDEGFKQFATDRQTDYINAVNEYGSNRKAALSLNVNRQVIDQAIIAVKKKAALAGFSPDHDMTRTVPAPFMVKV